MPRDDLLKRTLRRNSLPGSHGQVDGSPAVAQAAEAVTRHPTRVPSPLQAPKDRSYCLLREAAPIGPGNTSTPRNAGQTKRSN